MGERQICFSEVAHAQRGIFDFIKDKCFTGNDLEVTLIVNIASSIARALL